MTLGMPEAMPPPFVGCVKCSTGWAMDSLIRVAATALAFRHCHHPECSLILEPPAEAARTVLDSVPNGWAKVGQEWVRLSEDQYSRLLMEGSR